MYKSTTDVNARMMDTQQAASYCGMGQKHFKAWAEQIGAGRRYNRRMVFDRKVIDAALDALKPGETLSYTDPYDKRRCKKDEQ